MKEFIEKLIGRLEEKENETVLKAPNTSDISNTEYQKWMMKSYGFKESIEIVNQLAEEYGKDTNVTTNNGWIPCSKRLPEESELNNFTVGEFMDRFTEKAQDNMSILGYYVRDGHIWYD